MRGLTGRVPELPADRLAAQFVPPRHFAATTFASYAPDPAHPSQTVALDRMQAVAAQVAAPPRLFRRRTAPPAVYLDGGFGVGKTHLLAALCHAVGVERAA